MKRQILEQTAREYFTSGREEYEKKRYNSALVLFFKALVSLIDLYILEKTGITPSSHGDRFRTTQQNFPEVYDLLDKDFPFYQDSYVQLISKEVAEVIKNDAETMARKTNTNLL